MQPGSDLTMKLILGLSAVMTVMIGAVIYTVLFDPPPTFGDPAAVAPADEGGQPCDASDPARMSCPPGFYCQFDTCRPIEVKPECGEGDSCKDCDCKEGLVCNHFRCVDGTQVDRTPLECEKNEKLAEAVKTLANRCSQRRKGVDEIVSAGSCSDADWNQLAMEDEKFDLLLAAFPDRFAVLFPPNQPHLKKQDWPSAATREHFIAQIRRFREPLGQAKQIFVIGRSSPDGSAETNRLLTLRRMRLVEDLIDAVVFEGLSETERSRINLRIRTFALSSQRPIDPASFKESYLGESSGSSSSADERLVLADEASHGKLVSALNGRVDLKERGTPAWQELFNALNRVVLVVPIPCTGDEFQAPKSVLSADAPGEE